MKLLIASNNLHKIREYRAMLKHIHELDILSLRDFPDYQPLEEDKDSFKENAIQKAVHAAKTLNIYALGDDSGLIVPALNGRPGIYSARFAGDEATDKDNRIKLLDEMKELTDVSRAAYFECDIALASPENLVKVVQGYLEGTIEYEEKGSNGFGYDPIFKKHDYSKTLGELEEDVKNRISHRRKAFDKIVIALEMEVAKTQTLQS